MSTTQPAPPASEIVFYRAHGLGALIQRWEFEQTIHGFDELSIVEIHKGLQTDLSRWVETEKLRPYLTESEAALLAVPIGRWPTELVEDVGWRLESLGVMVWALGLIPTLPPYDRRCQHDDLLMHLRLGRPLRPQRADVRLRANAQLALALETAKLWEWRAQTAAILKQPDKIPAGVDMAGFVADRAATARRQGLVGEPIDGDLPALGRAYRALTDAEVTTLTAIAKLRADTLRWLCGYTAAPF